MAILWAGAAQHPEVLAGDICKDKTQHGVMDLPELAQLAVAAMPPDCVLALERGTGANESSASSARRDRLRRCEKELLSRCSPQLKPEISEDELAQLFKQLHEDPLLRAPSPGGLCERRAYLINKLLTDRGYQSERIYLEAPTIIGGITDASGKLVSAYHYVFHVVPSVRVKSRDGTVRTMILDPQFFGRPLPSEEYFAAVAGQSCAERDRKPADSRYACTYRRAAANSMPDLADEENRPNVKEMVDSCGWPLLRPYEAALRKNIALYANSAPEPLPFAVDSSLGPEKSALAWGLDRVRISVEKTRESYQKKLARLEAHSQEGETRYFLREKIRDGYNAIEVSSSQVEVWRERLRRATADLEAFPSERARILGLPPGGTLR